jgi:hypothetical protein
MCVFCCVVHDLFTRVFPHTCFCASRTPRVLVWLLHVCAHPCSVLMYVVTRVLVWLLHVCGHPCLGLAASCLWSSVANCPHINSMMVKQIVASSLPPRHDSCLRQKPGNMMCFPHPASQEPSTQFCSFGHFADGMMSLRWRWRAP